MTRPFPLVTPVLSEVIVHPIERHEEPRYQAEARIITSANGPQSARRCGHSVTDNSSVELNNGRTTIARIAGEALHRVGIYPVPRAAPHSLPRCHRRWPRG